MPLMILHLLNNHIDNLTHNVKNEEPIPLDSTFNVNEESDSDQEHTFRSDCSLCQNAPFSCTCLNED